MAGNLRSSNTLHLTSLWLGNELCSSWKLNTQRHLGVRSMFLPMPLSPVYNPQHVHLLHTCQSLYVPKAAHLHRRLGS